MHQSVSRRLWALALRQHGVLTRAQLRAGGLSAKAIEHRLTHGRLFAIHRGVYAVGRPQVDRHGRWMAAVLACGPGALLSHDSAAALWGLLPPHAHSIGVSVPFGVHRHRGITVHRRTAAVMSLATIRHRIPVTSVPLTLIDLATRLPRARLEAAINEADKRDHINPERLRALIEDLPRIAGRRALRDLLDARTFTLTDSALERRFLPIARRAGLPLPRTGERLDGFRVDFHWPEIGLVVETDGLRYHRTPAQQARDRERDQAHAASGLTPLRFTHAQVAFEAERVEAVLRRVACRLAAGAGSPRRPDP